MILQDLATSFWGKLGVTGSQKQTCCLQLDDGDIFKETPNNMNLQSY